ncbi:hypothetical protein Q764_12140 [Flavobacterium suncheonense GH29-5 = DSM 17707]|uniref:Uncharacterized protein n=1 Tax=Flavobacterium suncheonense GH29-5 = DSM 17707 TaxID=1121899 RepID=A0A0A2M8V2_9FLAO|nr:hypothetical protein Q764_12140 [Flavobacterium suncheonense GH29-5 = DSM 17707]
MYDAFNIHSFFKKLVEFRIGAYSGALFFHYVWNVCKNGYDFLLFHGEWFYEVIGYNLLVVNMNFNYLFYFTGIKQTLRFSVQCSQSYN